MMRIGIVSEDYNNDSTALKKLLEKNYDRAKCLFIPILKNVKGNQLEQTARMKRVLERESQYNQLDFIIFFRDLDGRPEEIDKIEKRNSWFYDLRLNKTLDIFLLAIYESEAFILADIETFNRLYSTNISLKRKPLFEPKPKEFLKEKTFKNRKQYHESHLVAIFEQLDFEKVYNTHCHSDHPCFQSFIDELDKKLS